MDSLSFTARFSWCVNVKPWQFDYKMKEIEYLGADVGGNSLDVSLLAKGIETFWRRVP
jgi:hypothetical protein